MPGYNLHTYKARFRAELRKQGFAIDADPDLPDAYVGHLIGEALLAIQKAKRIDLTRTAGVDIVAGIQAYAIPSEIFSSRIDRLDLLPQTGSETQQLEWVEYDRFVSIHNIDAPGEDKGTPRRFTLSRSNQRQILLGPTPNYSRSAALIFTGLAQSPPLVREYISNRDPSGFIGSATSTLSVTHGSPSATLSTSTPVDNDLFAVGDELGLIPPANADGSALQDITPPLWYSIDAIVSTTVTLGSAVKTPTGSGLNYVAAEVSPLEKAFPGSMGHAPTFLALADHLTAVDPGLAGVYEDKAVRLLEGGQTHPPRILKLPRPTAATSSMASRSYT